MGRDDESEIYRELMRFRPGELTPNGWAVKAGVSRTVWADMRRHGNPSRRTLEKLLAVAGSSLAEFEALRVLDREGQAAAGSTVAVADPNVRWIGRPGSTLPLVATAPAGEWGGAGSGIAITAIRQSKIVTHLPRPASLAADPDAYAVAVESDGMAPRFEPGMNLAISPRADVSPGNDVLVRLRPENDDAGATIQGMLLRLAGMDERAIELHQFNPARVVSLRTGDVDALHRIIGELI